MRVNHLFSLSLLFISNLSGAQPNPTDKVIEAEEALLQGSYKLAYELSLLPSRSIELDKLKILYHLARSELEQAEKRIEGLEHKYSELAETFAFSAEAWRSVGHQASLFSKRGYYQRAVEARIKAGDKAPNEPKYLSLKASALGQGSFGGDIEGQTELTKLIQIEGGKWAGIAQINLLQNQGRKAEGKRLAKQLQANYSNDFDVLERVAQFYWSHSEQELSQVSFYLACINRPKFSWHLQVKWINACNQVAVFAKKNKQNVELARKALVELTQVFTLLTEVNLELAEVLYSLPDPKAKVMAQQYVEQLVLAGGEANLIKRANKILKSS